MAENQPKLYEGLFLINQLAMAGDLSAAVSHVQDMLDRAGAETLLLRRWDERKLAYDIGGQRRGVYLLGLFKVNPVQIPNIERDCNLSEMVLRVMMLRGDHLGEAEISLELKEAEGRAGETRLRDEPAKPETADASA